MLPRSGNLALQIVEDARGGFDAVKDQFLASLGGKSPKTYATYQTRSRALRAFLESRGQLEGWRPDSLGPTLLEEFYAWLVRRHGRERRATVATYSSAARAFVRFLARRALLPSGVTYEQMRENATRSWAAAPTSRRASTAACPRW